MHWDIEKIRAAWAIAADKHHGQRYSGPQQDQYTDYLEHIGAVLLEVRNALEHSTGLNAELAMLCAILHDVVEDTDLEPTRIRNLFGPGVYNGVLALTKREDLPDRRAMMTDSLDRILAQPPEVAMVKMADRICNLGPPPFHWPLEKKQYYLEEAGLIYERLHRSQFLPRQPVAGEDSALPDPVCRCGLRP